MRPVSSTRTVPNSVISSSEQGRTARRDVGIVLDVIPQHLAIVHAVQMVAGEDQHQVAPHFGDDPKVAPHRVGGALEPTFVGGRLLCSEDLNEPFGEDVELVGPGDVPVQRNGVVLGQHEHPFHAGVDRVADGDVDQPVLAGDRYGRLGALTCQWIESLTAPSAENDDDDFP